MSGLAWEIKCPFCEKEELHMCGPPRVSVTGNGVRVHLHFYCTRCHKLSAMEVTEASAFDYAAARMVQSQEPQVPWSKWYERMAADAMANVIEPES